MIETKQIKLMKEEVADIIKKFLRTAGYDIPHTAIIAFNHDNSIEVAWPSVIKNGTPDR